ncbi:hypothetical protein PC123_g25238 [Phytophthora cactorum]|nr:hypothetical protein PC123_g25238 [Phytophthora cactorum]
MLVDLTTSHDADSESSGPSPTLLSGPPSSPSDTTSGAGSKSYSTGPLVSGSHAQLSHPTLLRGTLFFKPARCRSFWTQYTTPDYSPALAEVKAELHSVKAHIDTLTRHLDCFVIENADLTTRLKISERPVTNLEADTKQSTGRVVSMGKVVALRKAKLSQAVEASANSSEVPRDFDL